MHAALIPLTSRLDPVTTMTGIGTTGGGRCALVDGEAVYPGQHRIEDDGIRSVQLHLPDRRGPVGCLLDNESSE